MTFQQWLVPLGPEVTLLTVACLSLIVGVMRVSQRRRWVSPIALATVLAALIVTVRHDVPRGGELLPGL